MKLLALPTSPFAARVAIQVYEKGIDLPIERPQQGAGQAGKGAGQAAGQGADQAAEKTADQGALTALNPFRLTPILVVGETAIIESGAIAEYLEDIYPSPSLRGADAITTAQVRALVRAIDLYLFPAISALRKLPAPAESTPSAATPPGSALSGHGSHAGETPGLTDAMTLLHQVADRLQPLFFGGHGYACGPGLTLADCALVPACFHLERFLARNGQPSIFAGRPLLQDWWDTVTRHASVTRVLAQLEQAVNRAA